MKVFVVNCGSSSIKYQLFDMEDESVLAKGIVERIGSNSAELHHSVADQHFHRQTSALDHRVGLRAVVEIMMDKQAGGVLKGTSEIDAVGHRVVHGGEKLTETCIVDDKVKRIIQLNSKLSPLHNPANLAGIEAAFEAIPGAVNIAVFDTAFFATLPPKAYRYAVPREWYTTHHVRRYGFHGTSHRYVTLLAAELLGKPADQVNLITVHLGNGCSMSAIAGGKAVDHSMGMTPLEGLVMGTRSGDLDPAIVLYMIAQGMSPDQVDHALNKESGLLGVSGISNDMRDLLIARDKGRQDASLAVEAFVYRVVKYIGAYYTALPSLDAIVLTGGIGENSTPVRKMICDGLSRLGVRINCQLNDKTIRGRKGVISTQDSSLPVWIVPTNEELMIARDTVQLIG